MRPALLLVDLQRDFLATPDLEPPAETLIPRAATLLENCRRRQIPVIHIWTTLHRERDQRLPHWRKANRWQCVAGTRGHQPPAVLRPTDGEYIVHKTGFNVFANPELPDLLHKLGCDAVIVAGIHLHACVRAVVVECLERGLKVHVAADAVASNDPIHAAAVRRWLADRCVNFEPATALLARCDGFTLSHLTHCSPRQTTEVLFEVSIAGANEISDAAQAAHAAWGKWRHAAISLRCEMLERLAKKVEAAAGALAHQMAIEIGKPLKHGLEEVRRAAANVCDVARRAADQSLSNQEPGGCVRRQPLGVVGVISAWNNPVAIPLGKIAPALAYGNTVVWKPAPVATVIAQALMAKLVESGLHSDAVRLVTGDHTTALRLASDPRVSAITHTGSLQSGRALQEVCARRIVPLQAELSGNNAAIVWDDADLVRAAHGVAWGAFAFAGQRCTANRRVIVHAPIFEAFLGHLESAAARLPWGDPLDAAMEIGPLINAAKRDELVAGVAAAETEGVAEHIIRFHQSRIGEAWVRAGAYEPPVIVACNQPDHPLVQEESMSPLLVIQRAEDFDEALALCNGVRHGLVASLFSNREALRRQFMDDVQAGMLKFNAATAGADVTLPFGGWKASGVGPPEHGEGDRLFYTRLQAVYGAST